MTGRARREARRSGSGPGVAALTVVGLLVWECGDSGNGIGLTGDLSGETPGGETAGTEAVLRIAGLPETAEAGAALALRVEVLDPGGDPMPEVEVQVRVTRGGGLLGGTAASSGAGVREFVGTTDAQGRAVLEWVLGPAPVRQQVTVEAGGSREVVSVEARVSEARKPVPFGDLDGWMTTQGLQGSTEDLAFSPDGTRVVLGIPGGLLEMDPAGNPMLLALSGEPLKWVLGLAFDGDGVLWGADGEGKALRRVDPDGSVRTVVGPEGPVALRYPNDLAVTPQGFIALTDSCLGQVLVFRPDGSLVSTVSLDKESEGGPNGIAVDPAGNALWVTTENTALLCGDGTDPFERNGGLYRFELRPDGSLGARTEVAPRFTHFADGMVFDAEGNLYLMADSMDTEVLGLQESVVWVLPAEGGDLRRFLMTTDRVMANAVFGRGLFGTETMYLALISMPVVVPPEARGLVRAEIGIPGPPLPVSGN